MFLETLGGDGKREGAKIKGWNGKIMGSNKQGATLKFTGDEEAVDEFIVYASDNERGFAIFRLIGDDMEPDSLIKLLTSIDKGDVEVSQLKMVGDMFSGFEKNIEID